MMQMMSGRKKDVIIFNPTPNEYEAVARHVSGAGFRNINPRVIESGMGKINAAFAAAASIAPRLAAGGRPALMIGAGTSGSLSQALRSGDTIISNSAIVGDWRLEDGCVRQCAAYGQIQYRAIDSALASEMTITCDDPLVVDLLDALGSDFKRGRMLTADTFVSGVEHKLRLGRDFGCLACDMESGAFAYTATKRLGGVPWINIRIVADTIGHSLNDYVNMELDMTEILGRKTVEVLTALDALLMEKNCGQPEY